MLRFGVLNVLNFVVAVDELKNEVDRSGRVGLNDNDFLSAVVVFSLSLAVKNQYMCSSCYFISWLEAHLLVPSLATQQRLEAATPGRQDGLVDMELVVSSNEITVRLGASHEDLEVSPQLEVLGLGG